MGMIFCPECHSKDWQCLTSCDCCGKPVCDSEECGAICIDAIKGTMLCRDCMQNRVTLDGYTVEEFAARQQQLNAIVLDEPPARRQLILIPIPTTIKCAACHSTIATVARDAEEYGGDQCCEGGAA